MTKTLSRLLALPVAIALLGAGCGSAPAPSGSTGTPGSPVASGGAGRCVNLYYPLNAGSKIDYMMRGSGENIPFSIAVLEHDANNIKLEYTFVVQGRTAKITNELVCEGGTIRGKGYFDFASAFMPFDLRYEVIEMTGEIMPADLRVGREWTMTSKVKAITTDTSVVGRMMNGRMTTTKVVSKVVGEESVTVPAGTFRALKIEQEVTSSSEISGRPFSVTVTNIAWYAKDVGLIKSQNTGTGSDFVMEAQTISN